MQMSATKVELKSIDDALSEIPDEYQKMTQEEFRQMMQGGGR
jgi:hypothetical protein